MTTRWLDLARAEFRQERTTATAKTDTMPVSSVMAASHVCPSEKPHDDSVSFVSAMSVHISEIDPVEFSERAAIIEANGIPKEWATGYAALCTMPTPTDYTLERWRQVVDDGGHFLDRWGKEAAMLDWKAADVFGVDSVMPITVYRCMGLVTLLAGRKVCDINADTATIDCSGGVLQTFQRRNMANCAVALWLLK